MQFFCLAADLLGSAHSSDLASSDQADPLAADDRSLHRHRVGTGIDTIVNTGLGTAGHELVGSRPEILAGATGVSWMLLKTVATLNWLTTPHSTVVSRQHYCYDCCSRPM